jgi:Spy/CpxP family protein refolding chaperone
MRRKTVAAVLATLALAILTASASAQSNGGGNSGDAPGQARAEANCMHVWSELQADLVAGGGPKAEPVESIGSTTGPTNCDHFWQSEGIIGDD